MLYSRNRNYPWSAMIWCQVRKTCRYRMIHVGTLRWVKYKISGLYDWTWCWEQNVCMGSAFFTCCCLMCLYLISVASNRQKQQQRIQSRSLELQLLGDCHQCILKIFEGYKCSKMPSCLRLVPTRMTPLPTSKNTNHGKSTLAETCRKNLQMPCLFQRKLDLPIINFQVPCSRFKGEKT